MLSAFDDDEHAVARLVLAENDVPVRERPNRRCEASP